MKFSDYPIADELKNRLQALGFMKPTDIQFKAIRHILAGEDVFAVAQTGTGKTAAFAIPTLHMILQEKQHHKKQYVRCLVLVPTRELAQQIAQVYTDIGNLTGVRTLGLYGGVDQESQIRTLLKGVDVVVSTPGRMFDLISQGALDISHVRFLVLDEADLMLDLGFAKDIRDVLRKLPKNRQSLFFSATISKKIKAMAYEVGRNAIRIQISPKNPVSKNVRHAVMCVEMDDKRFFLENIIKEFPDKKVLVFVRTKVRVERVVAAMERVQIKAEAMHGGLSQEARFEIFKRFRSGDIEVLITTDVAARGIDIPEVEYVVNYDLPDNPENYVHRCGRTGRGRSTGQALSFCSESETQLLADIEEYTGEEIERYALEKNEYLDILNDSDDGSNDWQKLLRQANQEDGTEEIW
jgi:ATP-dependent RNA helicase RhlE